MTPKEMTEIFAVMKLAYPNAKMFAGGKEILKPTVELWTSALADVDYWTGQQALLRMCRESEFPSIAAFKTQADGVKADVEHLVFEATSHIRTWSHFMGEAKMYQDLPPGNPIRLAIDAIGGVEKLTDPENKMWRFDEFKTAYITILRNSNQLPGSPVKALPGTQKGNDL